jgi:pyruvate,water dikinase
MRTLAVMASRSPAVRDILTTRPYGARYRSIVADPGCRGFVEPLHQFLRQYGYRTAMTMEPQPSYPAWRDEPDHVLSLIGSMMNHLALSDDDRVDEDLEYREARAEMSRRLETDPRALSAFDRAVDIARGFVFAREASLYFLEEIVGMVRTRADWLGAWLVAEGRLDVARNIYYLTPSELEAAVSGKEEVEINRIAEHRQLAWEQMREAWNDTPFVERRRQTSMRGTAVSRGLAVGGARIIRGANDFQKLAAGDILVCPSTTPAWTPLFAIAAAVVADAGGVLSHAAIVAREYGIPAVMGCSDATRTLVDGEPIEVNGTTGTVRRLPPGARVA